MYITFCCYVVTSLTSAILALILLHGGDHFDCVGEGAKGIDMSYSSWLGSFAVLTIIFLVIQLGAGVAILLNFDNANIWEVLLFMITLVALPQAFMIAWFIIGTILYLHAVVPFCADNSPIYQFGLIFNIVYGIVNAFYIAAEIVVLIAAMV